MKENYSLHADTRVFSCYDSKEAKTSTVLSANQLKQAILTGALTNKQEIDIATITTEARRYYAQGNRVEGDRWKGKAPAITPAAVCHPTGGHSQQNIKYLTGLLMFDFDHMSSAEDARHLVQRLRQLPYTYASWITTSGDGVRLLVRYLPDEAAVALLHEEYGSLALSVEDYKRIWEHARKWIERETGHKMDPSTKDPSRLSYLCHDEEAYFDLSPHTQSNSLAIGIDVLRPLPPTKIYAKQKRGTFTTDPHTLAGYWLEQRGKYYHEGNRNNYLFDYACHMCKLGATEEECLQQAGQLAADLGEKERTDTVANAYRRIQEDGEVGSLEHCLRRRSKRTANDDDEEKPKKDTAAMVKAFLREHYMVRHNELTGQIEYCKKELLTDPRPLMQPFQTVEEGSRSLSSIWDHLNRTLHIDYPIRKLIALLRSEDVSSNYNPIEDYLAYCHSETLSPYANLPEEEWYPNPLYLRPDNTSITTPWRPEEDEIARLFGTIRTDMPADLLQWIGTKWVVSIAATALNYTHKGHLMLMLQGDGGTGKTNFFKSLIPPHAKELVSLFGSTSISRFANKNEAREAANLLSSRLIVLLDDIPEITISDMDTLKTILSQDEIPLRMLGHEKIKDRNRRATLCGTTNECQITNDNTAERRRIVTIRVQGIDHYGMLEVNHTRLYGQAVWLLHAGLQHWLTPDKPSQMERRLFAYTEQFIARSQEEELIHTYFYPPHLEETPRDPNTSLPLQAELMSATDARNHLATVVQNLPHSVTTRSLGKAFSSLGYKSKKTNKGVYYYLIAKPFDTRKQEAIEAARQYARESQESSSTHATQVA